MEDTVFYAYEDSADYYNLIWSKVLIIYHHDTLFAAFTITMREILHSRLSKSTTINQQHKYLGLDLLAVVVKAPDAYVVPYTK